MVAEEVFVNNYPHPEPDEIFSAGPIPVPLGRYAHRYAFNKPKKDSTYNQN
jgi:hypothetical protein